MNKYLHCPRVPGNRHLLPFLEGLLAPGSDEPLRHSPIFIVGAPRSGSTLVIQVLADAFDFGYISNRHCQWFGAPVIAEKIFHPLRNKPASDYQSQHGTTCGMQAPAECGKWWYRFFQRKPAYVTLDECDLRKMRQFRQSIAAFTNAQNRPILFKNLYASLRIQAIAHYIPEALFFVLHRDEVRNGHSLLEARMKLYENYDKWFSVPPPCVNELAELPTHEQVIEQIREIHRTIQADLSYSKVSAERVFHLNYEEFCKDTVKQLRAFTSFLQTHQVAINRTGKQIPTMFTKRSEVRIDTLLFEKMRQYARNSATTPLKS